MTTAIIDVVIPFYSNIEYLKISIQSVLNQTYKNFRILVVDDCSPNKEVFEMIESLRDTRITHIRNEKNLGLARNFEHALQLVRSDWFLMLGEDDRLHPNYLNTLSAITLEFPDTALIQPRVEIIDSIGSKIYPLADKIKSMIFFVAKKTSTTQKCAERNFVTGDQKIIPWLLVGNFFYFPTILWRTEVIKQYGFNTDYSLTLDLDLILRLLSGGESAGFVSTTLAQYRRHALSASNNPSNLIARLWEEKNMIETFVESLGKGQTVRILGRLRLTGRLHSLYLLISELTKFRFDSSRQFFMLTFF